MIQDLRLVITTIIESTSKNQYFHSEMNCADRKQEISLHQSFVLYSFDRPDYVVLHHTSIAVSCDVG